MFFLCKNNEVAERITCLISFSSIFFSFLVAGISDVSSGGSDTKRSTRRGIYSSTYNSTQTTESGSLKFTMAEIYKATKNFSPSLKIGQGGFGTVYKGRLEDGTQVAIKRAKKVSEDLAMICFVFNAVDSKYYIYV